MAEITKRDRQTYDCHRPQLERKLKPCGCASYTKCLTCGREDQWPEDHHLPKCPLYKA